MPRQELPRDPDLGQTVARARRFVERVRRTADEARRGAQGAHCTADAARRQSRARIGAGNARPVPCHGCSGKKEPRTDVRSLFRRNHRSANRLAADRAGLRGK